MFFFLQSSLPKGTNLADQSGSKTPSHLFFLSKKAIPDDLAPSPPIRLLAKPLCFIPDSPKNDDSAFAGAWFLLGWASLGIGGARSPLPKNFWGLLRFKSQHDVMTFQHISAQSRVPAIFILVWLPGELSGSRSHRLLFHRHQLLDANDPPMAPYGALVQAIGLQATLFPSSVPKCLLDPVNSGLGPRLNDSNRDYYYPYWLLATLPPPVSPIKAVAADRT